MLMMESYDKEDRGKRSKTADVSMGTELEEESTSSAM